MKSISVEIGGKVVLMEEPSNDEHQLTHYLPDEVKEKFTNDLSKIDGVSLKHIEGPLINGLWVATFEYPTISDGKLIGICKDIFIRYLIPNECVRVQQVT